MQCAIHDGNDRHPSDSSQRPGFQHWSCGYRRRSLSRVVTAFLLVSVGASHTGGDVGVRLQPILARMESGGIVTYIVGPVSILCDDTCTRVLRTPRNRKNICVVIYTCYHMLLYNIAINTSHVIDCKESQTVPEHTCLEMSSRHYYIRIVTCFNRRNLLKRTDNVQFKVY
jgi:hypothetical protein